MNRENILNKFESIDPIVKTLLYEGHNLYPYRPDAMKNQRRWNFGSIFPSTFAQTQLGTTDRDFNQTECLFFGSEKTEISVVVRFLHLINSSYNQTSDQIEEKGKQYWQECREREISLTPFSLGQSLSIIHRFEECSLAGEILVEVEELQAGIFKLSVRIENTSDDVSDQREMALPYAFLSTHTLMSVEEGYFISLLDPIVEAAPFVESCKNLGTFPVLAGNPANQNIMLSSPIILYDYPQIAPESQGDFFDGLEIDEMLNLRIQTLTEEEKQQMRLLDEKTRLLLERVESSFGRTRDTLRGRLE